jgi:nucleoside-diphosphate-sugar epimerase
MTRILITGAAGFIAGHLARALRADHGVVLVGADIRPRAGTLFDDFVNIDLADAMEADRLFQSVRPDAVFHLAGIFQGSDDAIRASNVDTTRSVIAALTRRAPRARIVCVGSAAEYGTVPLGDQPVGETFRGTPVSAYGRAKAEVTSLATDAAAKGVTSMVARPFNLIGPGVPESLVVGAISARLRKALALPGPRTVRTGNLSGIRDFIAVEDVVEGLVRMSSHGHRGETYNLCSGSGRRIADVVDQLIAFSGEEFVTETDPSLLRPTEVDQLIGSPEKAARDLGWRATRSFEESLRATWEATDPQHQHVA